MNNLFGKLFISARAKLARRRRKWRKNLRRVSSASDAIDKRIRELQSVMDEAWEEAQDHMKAGDRPSARDALRKVRLASLAKSRCEIRAWVADQLRFKLDLARTDEEFAEALMDIGDILQIDPDELERIVDSVQLELEAQNDMDDVWKSIYDEEMAASASSLTETVPSVEDMESQLEEKIAAGDSSDSKKETDSSDSDRDTDESSGNSGSGKDTGRAEKVSKSSTKGFDPKRIMMTRPETKLDDVAGMDEVKKLIRNRIITPFMYPEIWQRFKLKLGGGVLMYGPPGNGKTYIASAIAGELDARFFPVKLSSIMSQWVGATEKHLTELFSEAKAHERSVVFLDEVEALLAKRGSGSTIMDRAVPQFLAEVDGIEPRSNCLFLLGATNKPWMIDEAALRPGRFDNLIYVGLPDTDARRKIMLDNLEGIPFDDDVDIYGIASRLKGYSGADVAQICQEVKEIAANRAISAREEGSPEDHSTILDSDFEQVISQRNPSVAKSMMKRYEKFQKQMK